MSSLGEGDIFKFDAQYLYLWQNWDAPLSDRPQAENVDS